MRDTNKRQKFSIRKLYFGAASVVVGSFLYLGAVDVSATTATPEEQVVEVQETTEVDEEATTDENTVAPIESTDEDSVVIIDTQGQTGEVADTITTESSTITRTTNYVRNTRYGYATVSDPLTETYQVTRTKTTNATTGEETYSDWALTDEATYKVLTVKEIPGYTLSSTIEIGDFDGRTLEEKINLVYTVAGGAMYTDWWEQETQKGTITYQFVDENGNTVSEDVTKDVTFKRTVYRTSASDTTGLTQTKNILGDWYTLSGYVSSSLDGYTLASTQMPGSAYFTNLYRSLGDYDFIASAKFDIFVQPDDDFNVVVTYVYQASEVTETETGTITRTTNYVDTLGNVLSDPIIETFEITRTKTTNTSTGEVTYSDWVLTDEQAYKKVSVIDLTQDWQTKGYWYALTGVPEIRDFDGSSLNEGVVVVYQLVKSISTSWYTFETTSKNLTIRYVDENGNEIQEQRETTMGYSRSVFHESKGTPDGTVTTERYGNWNLAGVYKEPEIDGYTFVSSSMDDYLDEDGNPIDSVLTFVYKETYTTSTETKTIDRTINYVDQNGKSIQSSETNSYTFTRTVTTNNVTGEVTYGDWTTEDASYYTISAPTIRGYQVSSVPTVSEKIEELANQSFDVVYKSQSPIRTALEDFSNWIKNIWNRLFGRR